MFNCLKMEWRESSDQSTNSQPPRTPFVENSEQSYPQKPFHAKQWSNSLKPLTPTTDHPTPRTEQISATDEPCHLTDDNHWANPHYTQSHIYHLISWPHPALERPHQNSLSHISMYLMISFHPPTPLTVLSTNSGLGWVHKDCRLSWNRMFHLRCSLGEENVCEDQLAICIGVCVVNDTPC